MPRKKPPFDELPILRKTRPEGFAAGYRIYKDRDNFVVVQAETAAAALDTSGIKEPYKIERESFDAMSVLDIQSWQQEQPVQEPVPVPVAVDAVAP